MGLTAAVVVRALAPLADGHLLGPEVSLFIAAATAPTEIRQLQTHLAARPGVVRVESISRESALKSLAKRSGNAVLAEIKSNPLPDVLAVTFALRTPPAALEQAVTEFGSLPRVEAVAADIAWHRKLAGVIGAATQASAVFGSAAAALLALMLAGCVLLTFDIRTADLRVHQMVGADRRCIVRPFAYAGALTMGLSTLVAAAISWLGTTLLAPQATALADLYQAPIRLPPLPLSWLAAMAFGWAVVGGAVWAVGIRLTLLSQR
jgi:cell division protein FtsX